MSMSYSDNKKKGGDIVSRIPNWAWLVRSFFAAMLLWYVPLVVLSAGVGRRPQVIVIWLAAFLIMTVTIYQGVRNVDETLIKAARVLGARDRDIFVKVIFPATTPFIITAVRRAAENPRF